MLRVYFLQQWFALSDPGVEDVLYESPVLRRFAGIDLGRAPAPDETTILNFRHLLEEHQSRGQMVPVSEFVLQTKRFPSSPCALLWGHDVGQYAPPDLRW